MLPVKRQFAAIDPELFSPTSHPPVVRQPETTQFEKRQAPEALKIVPDVVKFVATQSASVPADAATTAVERVVA